MKCRFKILGLATGGDEEDIKMWLTDSINEYNVKPKVVDAFNVQVDEVDDIDDQRDWDDELEEVA